MVVASGNSIRFNSSYDNLRLVEKMVDEVCEGMQVSEDYYGNILIAVTEAVNNAIQHGNKSNPDKLVEMGFELKDNNIVFTVRDQGDGFDPANIPDPTDPANLEKLNGRGVFLMKNLADGVEFADNGRMVQLKFSPKPAQHS
jgi:serine/threonine-protein kinase RsbW